MYSLYHVVSCIDENLNLQIDFLLKTAEFED